MTYSETCSPVSVQRVGAFSISVQRDRNRQSQRRGSLDQLVVGTLELGFQPILHPLQAHPSTALLEAFLRLPGREKRERALRPEKVRDAHRAQLRPVEALRGEGDRNSQHRAPDMVVTQYRPERSRPPQKAQVGLADGNTITSDPEHPVGRADPGRREHGQIGSSVRLEEVVDVVLGGMRAGAEGGPRHRRDRGKGGLKRMVAPLCGQALEVGELALRHEAIRQLRVLAVEADDDEPSYLRLR